MLGLFFISSCCMCVGVFSVSCVCVSFPPGRRIGVVTVRTRPFTFGPSSRDLSYFPLFMLFLREDISVKPHTETHIYMSV